MHLTLHLTTDCTMRCTYCYAPPSPGSLMTEATARKAMEFARSCPGRRRGILFYGGEPLLRKDVIQSTIKAGREMESGRDFTFYFRATTNGTLLDREFLDYARDSGLLLTLSMDGVREAHDMHRVTAGMQGTYPVVAGKARLLLEYQPCAPVMMTVTPGTVRYYSASVAHLFELGFRCIQVTLDYGSIWHEEELEILQGEFANTAALYKKLTLGEKKFYLDPFERKLAGRIQGRNSQCQGCHLGYRQLSVSCSGELYPCIQFVGNGGSRKKFVIGDVWNGIDEKKREELFLQSLDEPEECRHCALSGRCEHTCGCVNFFTTGSVNRVSPLLCRTEQILVPIADRLGEELFALKAPMFLQKHYNPAYPVLSMLDDMER